MFIRVDLPAPFSPSRAWMVPGAMERSMWSLATRLPKRFVMPCSSRSTRPPHPLYGTGNAEFRPGTPVASRAGNSSISLFVRRLRRALRGHLDGARDDALLDRLQLGLQARRNLAGEVVERRQRHPAVLQRADVVA